MVDLGLNLLNRPENDRTMSKWVFDCLYEYGIDKYALYHCETHGELRKVNVADLEEFEDE